MVAPTAPAASPDVQQFTAMALSLAAVRQRVEQLSAGQEQLAGGQERMAREIAKLQEAEQDIRHKISAPAPRSAAAPPRKPMPTQPPPSQAPMSLR